VRRCLWYVSNGVQVALLVDPYDEPVLAFRPDRPAIAWRGTDQIGVGEVVPDFELTVDRLFSSLRQD
jgi:Uma2 family endonuclease